MCGCVFAHDESYARLSSEHFADAKGHGVHIVARQAPHFLLIGVAVRRNSHSENLKGSARRLASSRLTSAMPLSSSVSTKVRQGGPHFNSFSRERSRQETSATTAANSNTLVVCTALLMPQFVVADLSLVHLFVLCLHA